ncbi:MAG: metallophosphoesterase, partial [Lachnospiraceae bacterium]|nr:metallophosphoesterase [Lachnospiraceae bacterium]
MYNSRFSSSFISGIRLSGFILMLFFSFLVLSLEGCGSISEDSPKKDTSDTVSSLKVVDETIDVEGLKKEHKLYFLADSHISLCDERDKDLIQKARERSIMFKTNDKEACEYFDMLIDDANKWDSDLIIMGGDIIDSAMYASIDHVEAKVKELNSPFIYYMGNHDFEYKDEYFSKKAYEEYLPRLEKLRGKSSFQVREYEDIIILAFDDADCQISEEMLEAYKNMAKKDKPMIIALHVPINPVNGDDSLIKKCEEIYGEGITESSRLIIGSKAVPPSDSTEEFLNLIFREDSPVILV